MEQTTAMQEQGETPTAEVGNQEKQKPNRFISTSTLILAVINIIVGVVIDIVLEFDTGFSTFWTQALVGLFVVISAFTLRSRGMVSFLLNVGIFVYLYVVHIASYLFGTKGTL